LGHAHPQVNERIAEQLARGTPTLGILTDIAEIVVLVEPNDLAELEATIGARDDRIAAAILEPTGSIYGQVPLRPEFVRRLRALTQAKGIVLIFDEVVTGSRVAPGGAQQVLGIRPDLTTLAKILAGGLPGGAVVDRRDLPELLDPVKAQIAKFEKIGHQGTFNANPLSAAAGIATLELLKNGQAIARAHAFAEKVRSGAKAIFMDEDVPWGSYGASTGFFLNPNKLPIYAETFDPIAMSAMDLRVPRNGSLTVKFRLAMRLNGVDLSAGPGGPCSAAHDDADPDRTLTAVQASILALRQWREID